MMQFIRNFLTAMSYAMGVAFGWKLMSSIYEVVCRWLTP